MEAAAKAIIERLQMSPILRVAGIAKHGAPMPAKVSGPAVRRSISSLKQGSARTGTASMQPNCGCGMQAAHWLCSLHREMQVP